MVKKVVKEGKAKVTKGGDFNASQMVLIPREELFKVCYPKSFKNSNKLN